VSSAAANLSSSNETGTVASRWPRRAAVALVCATFPLIWVGGLVTSYEAGMAVHDWPTTLGYNMFLYPIGDWLRGPRDVFIEHGHRLLASFVGMLTIGVVLVFWRCEPRRWVRRLAYATLAAVILQGLLGGLRVIEDKRAMALVHGCVAQLFFTLTVTLAAVSSSWWKDASEALRKETSTAELARLSSLSLTTALLAYLQVVLGAVQRHFHQGIVFHLLLATALTVQIVWLAARVFKTSPRQPQLVRPAVALLALIAVQLCLGTAAWVVNHGWPVWFADYDWAAGYVVGAYSHMQIWSTTAHVAVGALIFATTWLLALRTLRLRFADNEGLRSASEVSRSSSNESRGSFLVLVGEGSL